MTAPAVAPTRVLHVIHGLGSGVEAVVTDYARAAPEARHHVLFSPDETCHDPSWAGSDEFESSHRVSSQPLSFARALRARLHELDPDVVHAHSSVAGAVVRLVARRRPIVYTPHCYAFLRQDLPAAARHTIRLTERLLARRLAAVAACSPHEAVLARSMLDPRKVHYIPNVARVHAVSPSARTTPATAASRTVVTSGRVSPQKGVTGFADVARRFRDRDDVSFLWVGGGDEELSRTLVEAGVSVTGWLDRGEATALLGQADLYVHTALWESSPLTVLEAAELDLPILARDTPALQALGLEPLWSSLDELHALIDTVLSGDLAASATVNRRIRAAHTLEQQRSSLQTCYRDVLGEPPPAPDPDQRN